MGIPRKEGEEQVLLPSQEWTKPEGFFDPMSIKEAAVMGVFVPVLQQPELALSVIHSFVAARNRPKSELEQALQVSHADTTHARDEASAALQKRMMKVVMTMKTKMSLILERNCCIPLQFLR